LGSLATFEYLFKRKDFKNISKGEDMITHCRIIKGSARWVEGFNSLEEIITDKEVENENLWLYLSMWLVGFVVVGIASIFIR
jgi:hypothetical protein